MSGCTTKGLMKCKEGSKELWTVIEEYKWAVECQRVGGPTGFEHRQRWLPPSIGSTKLNTDAAFPKEGRVGVGVILRYDQGEVLMAMCESW